MRRRVAVIGKCYQPGQQLVLDLVVDLRHPQLPGQVARAVGQLDRVMQLGAQSWSTSWSSSMVRVLAL